MTCGGGTKVSKHPVDGHLSSSWYRKPTDTGLTLNFHSLSPMKYKRSVVIGFVHRIYRSCSSWKFIHSGLENAKEILLNNQYPINFIEDIFKKTLNKIIESNQNISISEDNESEVSESEENNSELDPNGCLHNISEKDKYRFFVNYRGKPTEHFAQSLRKLNAPLKVVMTLTKTKDEISYLKTPVPHMLQNNVVYQINCPSCNASYVGKTSRHLKQRFSEHMGSSGIMRKHFESCSAISSEQCIKIIGKAKGDRLLSLEALFIHRIKPSLNIKDEYRSRELKLKF